jgi:hypothetical protein
MNGFTALWPALSNSDAEQGGRFADYGIGVRPEPFEDVALNAAAPDDNQIRSFQKRDASERRRHSLPVRLDGRVEMEAAIRVSP